MSENKDRCTKGVNWGIANVGEDKFVLNYK